MDLRRANVECVYWDDATVTFTSVLSTTSTPVNTLPAITLTQTDQQNDIQFTDYYGVYFETKNDTSQVYFREVASSDYPNCVLYGLNQLEENVEPVIFTQGQYPFLLAVPKARSCASQTLTTTISYKYIEGESGVPSFLATQIYT